MAEFEPAFNKTLNLEGGYSDNTRDSGGKTRYGITEAVARENGYIGEMQDLPLEVAKRIYLKRYWFPLRLTEVSYQPLADELFDSAVNCGVETAAKWLQVCMNALNAEGTRWPDVGEDGQVGPVTMNALKSLLSLPEKFSKGLVKLLNCLQGAYYVQVVRKTPCKEIFMLGWLSNRVQL